MCMLLHVHIHINILIASAKTANMCCKFVPSLFSAKLMLSAPNFRLQRQTFGFSAKLSPSAPNFEFSAKHLIHSAKHLSQRQTDFSAPNFLTFARLLTHL